jgi:thiamine-phosphate pyrophosphorylase
LPRLYAILDLELVTGRGLSPHDVLRQWLDAGVRLIQLRAKAIALGPMLDVAAPMAEACRAAGAIFIVNDRADVARLAHASGVHVGQEDLPPVDVRRVFPDASWVGLSTHSDVQLEAALESPATYLATGPVFATATKINPDPVIGLSGVSRAAERVRRAGRPLVAIGGITLATAPAVIAAGADSVAVISDLFAGADFASRAKAFLHALENQGRA